MEMLDNKTAKRVKGETVDFIKLHCTISSLIRTPANTNCSNSRKANYVHKDSFSSPC